ncbi:MAG TPA: ISKra4 family transposase, partial [Urbifossiella sp.]|nr:ISKra4 family transposase [Urbifossiella sp.]
MAVFAGTRDSFARARQALRELSGWDLDDDVIRHLTRVTARRATATRDTRTDDDRFARAPGVVEVAINAGKVNTDTGWREVEVAVVSQREIGDPIGLDAWDDRDLPAPSARAVVAGVEEAGVFAGRVRAEADRLGVTATPDVTVRGDGAEWIGNLGAAVFPQAAGVRDASHALEHVSGAVKAVWGADHPGRGRPAAGGCCWGRGR